MTYPAARRKQIMDTIVERLAAGEFMVHICVEGGMPDASTIDRWAAADAEFAGACARARARSAELYERRVHDVADKVAAGEMDATAGRVAANLYQWLAMVRDRSRYGDKVEIDGKLRVVPELELTLTGPTPKVIDVEPDDDDGK